jgi:peptidase E
VTTSKIKSHEGAPQKCQQPRSLVMAPTRQSASSVLAAPSKRPTLVAIYLTLQLINGCACFVNGFALGGVGVRRHRRKNSSIATSRSSKQVSPHRPDGTDTDTTPCWLSEGLLISSFTDGLKNNRPAHELLRRGLARAVQQQAIAETERLLADSVRASPCNGPNIQLLERLEYLDENRGGTMTSSSPLLLRVLFIPTAMYALRLDSTNTPGRQRQRARADAKQRRDEICTMLVSCCANVLDGTIDNDIDIHVVTVDLADGSVKQPEVWSSSSEPRISNGATIQKRASSHDDVPQTGRAAINEWKPHLIYLQGGNTFWLHHCLRDWRDDLRTVLTSGETFFCGASAGAIVAGQTVATALWKGWDDPRVVPASESSIDWNHHPPLSPHAAGLSLLGPHRSCFPHYDASWDGVITEQTAALRDIDPQHEVITIADDQVVYMDGRSQSIRTIYSHTSA